MNEQDKRELKDLEERAKRLLAKIEDEPQYKLSDWAPTIFALTISMVAFGIMTSAMNKIINKQEIKVKKKDGRKRNDK